MAVILRPKHIEGLWRTKTGSIRSIDRSVETYLEQQRQYLLKNPAASEPYEIGVEAEAYVGMGAWRVKCVCGEAPHVDPEWLISCCFGCGAIRRNFKFPAEWREIELLLAQRRVPLHRNWQYPESFVDLLQEQVEYGDPV